MVRCIGFMLLWTIGSAWMPSSGMAQESDYEKWHVVAGTAAQFHFGPQNGQVEITGEPDSLFFNQNKTYGIGFGNSVPADLTIGKRIGKNLCMELTVGWYSLDVAWQNKLDYRVQKEYSANVVHAEWSACLVIPASQAGNRIQWLNGLSAGVIRPLDITPGALYNPGFDSVDLDPGTQFHAGILSMFDFRLFRSPWFARVGVSFDFPGLLVGRFATVDDFESIELSTVEDEVRMYTLKGMAGIGYRFGATRNRYTIR